MKIVAARLNHETNTFSPVPTPLASFGPDGPTFGEAAYRQAKGSRTALGAFIEAAERRGADVTVAVNATANPSGRVDAAAYERLAGAIVEAVRAGCDAILLDLHGAMVSERFDDGEGELLRRIRDFAPNTPLAVALDLHGNVTQAMVDAADVIVGFKTYPHVDMFETGVHAARLLFDWIDGGPRPHVAWAQPPLLSHTLRSATGEGAMQRAVERARSRERDGLLAATVFAGFSLADFQDAGVSVVTVGCTHGRSAARRGRAGARDLAGARRFRLRQHAARRQRGGGEEAEAAGRRAPRAAARPRRQRDVRRNVRHDRRCSRSACARGCRTSASGRCAIRPRSRSPRPRGWARRWTSNSATSGRSASAPIRVRGCARGRACAR